MARSTFGGGAGDWVFSVTPGNLVRVAAATLTFWDANTGGTQHTDLLIGSTAVTQIIVGEDGQVPEFRGPDGVYAMWADTGTGAPRVQVAAGGDIAVRAETAAADAEAAAAAAQAVGDTNDTIIAGRGGDPASATFATLGRGRSILSGAGAAVGDDTADDSAAINARLIADASFGISTYVPEGHTFKCDSPIEIPTGGRLVGGGSGSVLRFTWSLASGAGATYFVNSDTVNGNENIHLRDLAVEGPGDGTPLGASPTPVTAVLIRTATDVSVKGCLFYRIPGAAVHCQGVTRVALTDNVVLEGGRGGLVCVGYGATRVSDVRISNNTIHVVGDDGIAVSANNTGNPTNTAGPPTRIAVVGNTIYGGPTGTPESAGRGILLRGVEDATVADNTITDVFAAGIYVIHDEDGGVWRSSGVTIAGNTIARAGVLGGVGGSQGVRVFSTDDLTITGNTIKACTEDGILVQDVARFSIAGNVLNDNGTSSIHFGVHLTGTPATLDVLEGTVTGNTITGTTGAGIRSSNTQDVGIHSNTVLDNGTDTTGSDALRAGIHINTTGVAVVAGNICRDTRPPGAKTQTIGIVNIGACAALVLADNLVLDNAVTGISPGAPVILQKRGNIESTSAVSNFDRDTSGARRYSGTGDPNGAVSAPVGSTHTRTDGGAGTTLYVKESGTGNTGWVAK